MILFWFPREESRHHRFDTTSTECRHEDFYIVLNEIAEQESLALSY
jgi:hypothetical protein